MFDCKTAPGTPHSSHDFIGDEQNTVPTTDLGYLLEIAFRGNRRTQSRAAYRLRDKGCGFAIGWLDGALQLLRIFSGAFLAVVCAAIAVWECDLRELPYHR